MKQIMRLFLIIVAAASLSPAWAEPYKHFSPPHGNFVFDYPAGWKYSPGMQTVNFMHLEGKEAYVRISAFPLNRDDPATPDEYVTNFVKSMELYEGRLNRKDRIQVAGRNATILEFTEMHGTWGRAYGVEIIVPNDAQYYVLSLFGKASDVTVIRPEFDRIVSSFRLEQAPSILMEWGGAYDGPREAKRMVARSPEELHEMIRVFGPAVTRLLPEGGLNFSQYMLAGISLGQKPTGGYSVEIVDTHEQGNILYVRYREQSPTPASIVTQALTAPYHLKLLPAGKATSVKFEKIVEPEIYEPDKSPE